MCSSYDNVMHEADMRFVSVWPPKEKLTLWNYPTTTKVVNICLPNLHGYSENKQALKDHVMKYVAFVVMGPATMFITTFLWPMISFV